MNRDIERRLERLERAAEPDLPIPLAPEEKMQRIVRLHCLGKLPPAIAATFEELRGR